MNKQVSQNNKLSPEQARTRQLILIISLIGFVATTILTGTAIVDKNLTETVINGTTALLLAISLITAWFSFTGFGRIALPFTALVSITYLAIIGDGIYDPGNLAFAIVIAIAALLLGARGLIIFGALSVAAIFGIIYAGTLGNFGHTPASAPDVIAALMGLIVSTIILYLNTRQLEQSLSETRHSEQAQIQINQELFETKDSLEEQTQELAQVNELNIRRVDQLRLVAEVANSAASIQELEELLTTISGVISQRFDVYHTGIFLLDSSRDYAILRASNSDGGQKMLARGYRFYMETQGIVSSVIATGKPRIALDMGMNSAYLDIPDLPDTRSEIALPLKIAGETIGALDLQSMEPGTFSQEDIDILSILADQLAIAIQNARSFESARRSVHDAETAYQQLTGETWNQFAKDQPVLGYHFDGIEIKSVTENHDAKAEATLQIPVRLRGREIGKLKLTSLGSERIWSDDEIAMVESAAERAALSLENARLLEDAQRRAAKEIAISKISTKISGASETEMIMAAGVSELQKLLGASEVTLRLTNKESQ
jgi:GAF domain-containing protein